MSFYDRGLKFVFRHQFSTLMATLLLMAATGYLYIVDPQGLLSRSRIPASSSARPRRARTPRSPKMPSSQNRLSAIVQKDPAVSGVLYFAGAAGVNPTENTARMFIQLKPHDERDVTSAQSHPAPAPQGGAGAGREVLHAVGPGHQHRRPAQPDRSTSTR